MKESSVLRWSNPMQRFRVLGRWFAGCVVLIVLTAYGVAFHAPLPTMGFLYLLLVVAVASIGGFWPATLTSIAAVACLDYYFTPPIFTFNIDDPQDWVSLFTFEVTAVIVSRLATRERRSSSDAALHRMEMEKLYELSRNSLLLDMRQPPGPQLVVLIQRVFGVQAIALFDMVLGRQDRAGEWNSDEEDIAKECFLRGEARDNLQFHTSERVLFAGSGAVGALVVRGALSPLLINALAALAAIAIDRHQWIEKEERAESACKGEQLRGAVMDALAHELKTPLTAVQTASSGLIALGGLTTAQRDLVTLIDGEAIRLNKLCTRLLVAARLEAEKVGLNTDNVNVRNLVLDVLATQTVQAERDRMKVVTEDPALTVRVDRALLEMILAQYIDNARKYSTPDTPIEIETRKNRTEVLISVHNFGSTIRIEDRERIFDRFYRSPDLKDSTPGTGIGLSVVKKAAEAHHGHVWAVSDDKEGTTFFLALPTEGRRTL
jgi:two-component system, OmpR family, sensor histidine kinase KdpD